MLQGGGGLQIEQVVIRQTPPNLARQSSAQSSAVQRRAVHRAVRCSVQLASCVPACISVAGGDLGVCRFTVAAWTFAVPADAAQLLSGCCLDFESH